jgi:predicted Zn-dependent protease
MIGKIIIITLSCFLCGCAATDITPVNKGFALTEEEEVLWHQSEESQEAFEKRGMLYDEPELLSYINEVAVKLHPEEINEQDQMTFEVFVLKNPLLNAITFPNGKIYIHTGILARMENEAQLATLLAHEMSHAVNRDSLTSYRDLKNKTAFLGTMGVIASGFGTYGNLAHLVGSLGVVSSIYGYSRELEEQADLFGLNRMYMAGYDPNEAPKLFSIMQHWLEINDIDEPFFFGTHPKLQNRINSYNFLLANQFKGLTGKVNDFAYQEKTEKVNLLNAALNIKAGRFKVAEQDIWTYLDRQNESAEAFYLLGEICTQNETDKDTPKAVEFYTYAIHLDPNYPNPHRELGLINFKEGRMDEAEKYFTSYLNLAPNAIDRGYIEANLKTIHGDN